MSASLQTSTTGLSSLSSLSAQLDCHHYHHCHQYHNSRCSNSYLFTVFEKGMGSRRCVLDMACFCNCFAEHHSYPNKFTLLLFCFLFVCLICIVFILLIFSEHHIDPDKSTLVHFAFSLTSLNPLPIGYKNLLFFHLFENTLENSV